MVYFSDNFSILPPDFMKGDAKRHQEPASIMVSQRQSQVSLIKNKTNQKECM